MADLKKLALGRKGIQKAAPDDVKVKKPRKTLEQSSAEEVRRPE